MKNILLAFFLLQAFSAVASDKIYPPKSITLLGENVMLSLTVYDPPVISETGKITNRSTDVKTMVWLPTWNKTNDFNLDISYDEYKTYFTSAWWQEQKQELTEAQFKWDNDYKRNPHHKVMFFDDTMFYQCIITKPEKIICILGHTIGKNAKLNPSHPVQIDIFQFDAKSKKWLCDGLSENKELIDIYPAYLNSLISLYNTGQIARPETPTAIPAKN